MYYKIFLMLLVLPLTSCASHSVYVYESKGDKSCDGGGISLSHSKNKLLNNNITVMSSSCGTKTGIYIMTMCGAPTNNILVHQIKEQNLNDAKKAGFNSAHELINKTRETGYKLHECPQL